MPSKSGSNLKINEEVRGEISSYPAVMCTVGEILRFSARKRIIAVGDVTVSTLREAGVPVFLEVVDLKTQRKEDGTFQHVDGSISVANPAATLTKALFSAIGDCIGSGKKSRIEVVGEEDLAVIPIIFYSDLNTVVVYGVPHKGMACIDVDEKVKSDVERLIKRMEVE